MAKNTTYDIVKAFEAIENELMASMIRNMQNHKLEEIGEKKQWTMWQAEQLKTLEQYRRSNEERFGKDFKQINDNIELLIRMAKDEGEMEQEIEILRAIKKGYKARKVSQGAAGEFFKINERKLDALIKATVEDMQKAETAILRMAEDQYRKIIYNAQVYANTGAGTYEKAVDMATKDMLAAGLNCIEYANGARHTLKDYANMAIRTASKRAYLQGEGTKRQEWGIATVIVNKRGNPCPKCLPFCGKVFIDDVWSGGSAYHNGKQRNRTPKSGLSKGNGDGISSVTGLTYPLMSQAVAAGLYHPNCRDVHTTYFEGVNTPPDDKYTKQELNEIAEKYRQEQKLQYAKRQEEKFNRLATYSLDNENQKKYGLKAKEWKRVRFRTGNQSPIEYAADKGAYSSKFSDVTRQWLDNAKPKDYSIEKLSRIKIGEKIYEADGINVIHNNSIREVEVAELLKPIFKEKITFVPEVKGKYKGVKTSDYLIGDERWDLKELKGESKDAVRNAISKCKEQANNFIIDITSSKLPKEEIARQVENVFNAPNTRFVKTLIVIDGDKVIRVIKRK